TTLDRWLSILGFDYTQIKKDVYEDGHERSDVVAYRGPYCAELLALLPRSTQWEEQNGGLVEVPPVLVPGEEEIVFVVQDESAFAANNGKKLVYLQHGENVLRPKGNGKSLMISGFNCQCHG
ncbi:hypothetical protein BCR33DRAFT_630649, partial [Rhizoclosmatium globosum]